MSTIIHISTKLHQLLISSSPVIPWTHTRMYYTLHPGFASTQGNYRHWVIPLIELSCLTVNWQVLLTDRQNLRQRGDWDHTCTSELPVACQQQPGKPHLCALPQPHPCLQLDHSPSPPVLETPHSTMHHISNTSHTTSTDWPNPVSTNCPISLVK